MRLLANRNLTLYLSLAIAVALNVGCWFYSNDIYTKWTNIPPAPAITKLKISFLDDSALAYRVSGLTLQNFGNVGESQNLKNYNYKHLAGWFSLMDALDVHSNYVPYFAAYYFGATPDDKQVEPVIKYLETVGVRPEPGKWRWLAQAAFLARHRLKDMDWAMRIAQKLGSIYDPKTMPTWTRNMEPMLTADMGDRQAAYLLMLEILKSDGDKMSVSEYNSNIHLICTVILTPEQAVKSPLCEKKAKD